MSTPSSRHLDVFHHPPAQWEHLLDGLGLAYHDAWQLIWQEAGRGTFAWTEDVRRVLLRRLDHLHPEGALALVPRLLESAPPHPTLEGFDVDSEVLLERLSRVAPDALDAAHTAWPAPHRHVAALYLATHAARPLPADSLDWLARASLVLPDGDDHVWFDRVARVAGPARWEQARIEGLSTMRVANLAAAEELFEALSPEARVAFARRHGQDAASLMVAAAQDGLFDLADIEASGPLPSGSALLYAYAITLVADGLTLPPELDQAVADELRRPPPQPDLLHHLMEALPPMRAERLLEANLLEDGVWAVLGTFGTLEQLERAVRSLLARPVPADALPPSDALARVVEGSASGAKLAARLMKESLPLWGRLALLEALATTDVPDLCPCQGLSAALTDGAASVRALAARLLVERGDEALPCLTEALLHPRADIRRSALDTLEQLPASRARRQFALAQLEHARAAEVRGVLGELAGLHPRPMSELLRRMTEAERIAHYQALARASTNTEALVEGLRDPSEAVREAVRRLLPGTTPAAEALGDLLHAPRQSTRQAAAQALTELAAVDALDVLWTRLQAERTPRVALELRRAIVARLPPPPLEASSALLDWLGALPHVSDLELDVALPALRLSTGAALPAHAAMGWLTLLSLESPDRPSLHARALRPLFDLETVHAVGHAVHEAWVSAGRPKSLTWARWQMAISADEGWLYEVGMRLHETWTQHHVHGQNDIDLLRSAESEVATLWLHFWLLRADPTTTLPTALEAVLAADRSPLAACRLEMFTNEVDALHLPTLDFDGSGRRSETRGLAELCWQLVPAAADHGATASGVEAVLTALHPSPHARTRDDRHLHRLAALARQALQHEVDTLVERLLAWLAEARAARLVFTVPGWRRLFAQHPLLRALTQQVVFGQGARTFTTSMVDSGELRLREGAAIRLEPIDTPHHAPSPPALAPQTVGVVLDLGSGPRDLMTELRDLLYQAPGRETWERICAIFATWPVDNLGIGLDYARAHLATWGAQPRHADIAWIASLLPTEHPVRGMALASGHRVNRASDPRLMLANSITLMPGRVDEDVAESLVRSPHLHTLEELHLIHGRIYRRADTILGRHDAFPALHTLVLHAVRVARRGFPQLVRAPWFARLRHLKIHDGRLTDEELEALIHSGALAGLETLRLSAQRFTAEGIALLATCPDLAGLRSLDLSDTLRGPQRDAIEQVLQRSPWLRATQIKL